MTRCYGNRVFLPRVADKVAFALLSPRILALSRGWVASRLFVSLREGAIRRI